MLSRSCWLIGALHLAQRGFGQEAQSFIATFGSAGIRGTVTLTQVDPTERVRVAVSLDGLKPGTNWTINEFPVLGECSVDGVGLIFNPNKANPSIPCQGSLLSQCVTGDMGGKFGALTTTKFEQTFFDETLTLYGAFSIAYRSVVLNTPDGEMYACATIQSEERVNILQAKFEPSVSRLVGSVWMIQAHDSPQGDTVVLVDLSTKDGSKVPGALYHVHEGSMLSPTSDCKSLGYHFNPTSAGPCSMNPNTWKTCELGDISGRHGPVDLPSTKQNRLFFVDTSLALSGNNSMSDRSLVFHNSSGARVACAPLVQITDIFFAPSMGTDTAAANSSTDSRQRRLR